MDTKVLAAGLPRSGTLWLATYLTCNGIKCIHEYSINGGLEGFDAASGSDCLDNYNQLTNELPEAKWIIIDRRLEESVESFHAVCPSLDKRLVETYFRSLKKTLRKACNPGALVIEFDNLFKETTLKLISAFVGFAYNKAIAKQMINSKIILHPRVFKKWELPQV